MICKHCGLPDDVDGPLLHPLRCDGQQGKVEAALGFDTPEDAPAFDGETYDPAVDHDRLGAQALRVWHCLSETDWLTLAEIEAMTGDPQASISARLRDFRKRKFGAHVVERRRRELGRGLWEYRVRLRQREVA